MVLVLESIETDGSKINVARPSSPGALEPIGTAVPAWASVYESAS